MKEITVITKEAIQVSKDQLLELVNSTSIIEVERDKDLKEAKVVRKLFKDKRIEIEKQANDFTKQLNNAKREIKDMAIDLIGIIKPFEEEQDSNIKAFEEERARKRREAEEQERNRLKKITETIAGFKSEVNSLIDNSTIDNIQEAREFVSSFDFDAQEHQSTLDLFIRQSLDLINTKEPILKAQREQEIREQEEKAKEAERIAKEKAIKEAQEKKEAELRAKEEELLKKEREAILKVQKLEQEAKDRAENRRIELERELEEENRKIAEQKRVALEALEAKERAKKEKEQETVTILLSEYNRLLEIEKKYNKLCN